MLIFNWLCRFFFSASLYYLLNRFFPPKKTLIDQVVPGFKVSSSSNTIEAEGQDQNEGEKSKSITLITVA